MEIDLEQPSHEQETLDVSSNTHFEIVDKADRLNLAEEDLNSNMHEHGTEAIVSDTNEGKFTAGDQVGVIAVGAGAVCKRAILEPCNGLKFETKEAAYSFYREYARSVGFGITIKASRRSKRSGKFIDVKIACSRFGNRRESNSTVSSRTCLKTNCKAGMHMKRTQDEKWIICGFVKEHNHEICPDDVYSTTRGQNKQPGVVACQKKGLQLALDEDNVQLMLEQFMCMQSENPNFFYAIDLDNEKRMRNVFWVDAKGRRDYSSFCDVVFFETFYVRSNYRIPCVPIIGVNHHFQFLLLGCALIGEKTVSTFSWLMRTWLRAVGGQAPKVIITDQHKFLSEAVANVFPDTRHCYCLWHIFNKMDECLSFIINENEHFMEKFNKCIHQSWTEDEFEKRWWKMVDKFELREDKWVHSLYEDREKWVPAYMRNTFLAGMCTVDRSGSIASFFDKYIHKEATLKEFMEQYKTFLQYRLEAEGEAEADFETQNKHAALRSLSAFEKQMSTIYTDAVFKKFQVEVLGAVSCHLQKESENGATLYFWVDDFEERQKFLVSWNEPTFNICCLCRSFEYRGLLCKHAILVLQMSSVSRIPSPYILKRWTKDAKISKTVTELSSSPHYRLHRFNDLCKQAMKLGEEGSLSEEAYAIAFKALEEALENCVGVNNGRSVSESNALDGHGFLGIEDKGRNNVRKSCKRKKMQKRKKAHSDTEGIQCGLHESCQQMEPMSSRALAINNCYFPQQDMQEMGLGSRAATLDVYYDSHGQSSSLSPIREDYYGAQQGLSGLGQIPSMPSQVGQYGGQQLSMQGLGQLAFRSPAMQVCFDVHDSLQDLEQPVSSTQFQGIASKQLHDKGLRG